MRILIVEDDKAIQDTLTIFLCQYLNLECNHAYTVKEAIHYLEYQCPDVVILDLLLGSELAVPVLTFIGNSFCKPKVIITSALKDGFEKVKEFNISAYIVKPFDLEVLETSLFKK